MDTLLLNADYKPKAVLSWQKAIELVLRDVVYTLAHHEDWTVRSPSKAFDVPAVLLLKQYVKRRKGVTFNRTNVYIRDGFSCQYCGANASKNEVRIRDLTFDHVIPRAQGGKTTWQNIATACKPCNKRKADRLPSEAGMPLLQKPYEPKNLNDVEFHLVGKDFPDIWTEFLPDDSIVLAS